MNISKIIEIDDQECMDEWPCRHTVKAEYIRDDEEHSIETTKMKADDIFHLCCRLGHPIPKHIKDGFVMWLSESQTIHIRIIQNRGRKKLTICQGLDPKTNMIRVLKALQKNFDCGGSITEHKEYGRVVQLQGDHATNMKRLLVSAGLAREDHIYIHGDTS